MRKFMIPGLLALVLIASCRQVTVSPRPTVPLVYSILADTAGTGRLAARAGDIGVQGSIALIGQAEEGILLARRFLSVDQRDNVDGRMDRDSLPDFAGESFDVILDVTDAPYTHFLQEGPDAASHLDSLRENAVRNAVFAWDSLCYVSGAEARATLSKQQAKILIYTSSLQAEWGLFDVDTLLQLSGGRCRILSPVHTLLDDAQAAGASNLAVWTSRDVRASGAWENVFARRQWDQSTLHVLSPDIALDVRTEFRQLLRQYRATGLRLDVLLLDSYYPDIQPLLSELAMIRRAGTEEDAAFDRMLAPDFQILDPTHSLIRATYNLLRQDHLFTHRIARPQAHYYETVESGNGVPVLVEVTVPYIQQTYVPHFD